jgi:hypothetical protein
VKHEIPTTKKIAAGFLLEIAVADESVPFNKPSLVDEGK